MPRVLQAVAAAVGVAPAALVVAGRPGQSGRVLAAALGLSHQAVYAAATRGEQKAIRWQGVWQKLQ